MFESMKKSHLHCGCYILKFLDYVQRMSIFIIFDSNYVNVVARTDVMLGRSLWIQLNIGRLGWGSGVKLPSIKDFHCFRTFGITCPSIFLKHVITSSFCNVTLYVPSSFDVHVLNSFKVLCTIGPSRFHLEFTSLAIAPNILFFYISKGKNQFMACFLSQQYKVNWWL